MSTAPDLSHQVQLLGRDVDKLRQHIARTVVGQQDAVEGVLVALLAGGHVLLEGHPGTGKTVLARAVAGGISGSFRRIQFTPDLMPADLIGTYVVLEQHGRRKFEFTQGPLFANFVLADEINRATPKTQSGLLEAMEDGAVTVANERYELPRPFHVLATQSPTVGEGTFPLPETQLDRFLVKLAMPAPEGTALDEILSRTTGPQADGGAPAFPAPRLIEMQQVVRQVAVGDDARRLAARLVEGTQPENPRATEQVRRFVRQGAGVRGGQALLLCAKARAALAGRTAAAADDVRAFAAAALRHRVSLSYEAHAELVSADDVVREVLSAAT